MSEQLPLFPLKNVLFPGMLLPLHIFESRYRALVRRCLDSRSPFGVVLIRSGEEVGPPAEPHEVGTSARIVAWHGLRDGRFFIVTRGERRFAIEELVGDEEPYLVGRVRYLDETDGDDAAHLAREASEAFAQYRLAVASVGTQRYAEPATEFASGTPIEVSYQIATGLAIDAMERQRFLEAPTAAERLALELRLLERENALLTELLVRQRARKEGPRPN